MYAIFTKINNKCWEVQILYDLWIFLIGVKNFLEQDNRRNAYEAYNDMIQ
jgi:hypothetical protein